MINIDHDLVSVDVTKELLAAETAVQVGVERVGDKIKNAWRREVRESLGTRLGNAIRRASYPAKGVSLNAAALVFARPGKGKRGGAAEIILGHEKGSLIRASRGVWLAIPTEEAGKGKRGASLTPEEWQRRHGTQLQFIPRRGGPSLLVAPVKLTKSGRLGKGRMTKSGSYGKGVFTSVIFLLVPQVRLRKKLNLMAAADRLSMELPQSIVSAWRRKE